MNRLVQLVARIVAWILIASVTFATLGPPRYRPTSDLGQGGEHSLAFVLVGFAIGIAYPRRPWLTAAIAVFFTGVVELLQFFAPGRHARLGDFIVDALALCAGLILAAGVHFILGRWRQSAVST